MTRVGAATAYEVTTVRKRRIIVPVEARLIESDLFQLRYADGCTAESSGSCACARRQSEADELIASSSDRDTATGGAERDTARKTSA